MSRELTALGMIETKGLVASVEAAGDWDRGPYKPQVMLSRAVVKVADAGGAQAREIGKLSTLLDLAAGRRSASAPRSARSRGTQRS